MTHAITKPTLAALTQSLGSDNVSTDLAERELFSQDIWAKGETADFVISPKNTQDLAEAVKLAARDGVALNPRGGGMSYTKGYTPSRSKVGI